MKEIAVFKISLEIGIICYPNDNSQFTALVVKSVLTLATWAMQQWAKNNASLFTNATCTEGLLCPYQYHPWSDTLVHDRKKFRRIFLSNFVFVSTLPGLKIIKQFTNVGNKLKCSSVAGLSSLVCLRVNIGAYPRVERLKN